MVERTPSVADLLDLAASTDDETIRRHAILRLQTRNPRTPQRATPGARGASVSVEKLLGRFDAFGIPGSPRTLDPRAVTIARSLACLDNSALDRVAIAAGVVEAATLACSIDRTAAADVLRAIETVRDRLKGLAKLSPNLSAEGLSDSILRFSGFVRRGFAGDTLVRALGRSLLATLIANAEPDVVAALRLRLPRPSEPGGHADAEWISVVASVIAEINGTQA